MSIDDIVNVQITATSRTPSSKGFGVTLIARYHALNSDWVRSYASADAMAADGVPLDDPAYLQAQKSFSQKPSPKRVKLGRRATAPAQVIDLTPATPALNKKYSIDVDGQTATYTADGDDILSDVCTALAAAINAVNRHDADAIITNGVSTAGIQTLTSFNGVIGGGVISPAQSLEITFSSHADWDATTAVATGLDPSGRTITQNITIPNGGGTTVLLSKRFKQVTQLVIPAQSGTGGTYTLGVRARFTAASTGTKVTVTTTDSTFGVIIPYANWVNTEGGDDTITLADVTADAGIVSDLVTILAADKDWYGLVLDSNSKAEIEATAAWAETQKIVFWSQTADGATFNSSSTTDVGYFLKAHQYARSLIQYHPSINTEFLAAGGLGGRLARQPGSWTYALKSVVGVASYPLTDTQSTNIRAKNVGTYTNVGGVDITLDGKSSDGEYMDIVIFVDWLHARMQEALFALLVNAEKFGYTDESVAIFVNEMKSVLGLGVRVGGLTKGTTTAAGPKVDDVPTADRQNRRLPDLTFSGRLQGAIQELDLAGTLSV